MRPHKIIFATLLLVGLLGTSPAPAGAGANDGSEGVATLTLSLGLHVEAEAISLDGVLLVDKGAARTTRVTAKTIRIVRGALLSHAVTRAHEGYTAGRVLRQSAGRIIGHWVTRQITGPTQRKGPEDADRR